ncbi:hypothetical protein [Thiobacillus sedimenti]|uniref:Uncharacterized protein n=1 Tax=Thiobacillus sedimenti TaxID=3110231 RepID=A0ABZ1CIQ6_9PROT|nr:hypothetical protein [Thiobacillus sp. SCUT-2]WRS39287.1 hypothetical protein VA613_00030 [Thiobacillus sp. SCUT-2]
MQTLAAYRLETKALSDDELQMWWSDISGVINKWLKKKGVADTSSELGAFASETSGAKGTFTTNSVSSTSGELTEIVLTEPTKDGHTFTTSLAITNSEKVISVYLTLSASITGNTVAPTTLYPRCPTLIREMLTLRSDWMFGGSEVPDARPISVTGEEAASVLAGYLMNERRTLPVTVVSDIDGEPIWNDLPEKLAIDLAGLSSVVRIDGEASWALTDLIGKSNSCYLGAVRIYWPLRKVVEDTSELRSKVWTAERLLSSDTDGKGLSRFTTSLRRDVMNIAALVVDAPPSVRKIKTEVSRARLSELQAKADANSEELELARLFIEENETLKDELEKAKIEISKQAARAEAAEYALDVLKSDDSDKSIDDQVQAQADKRPKTGEIRYYKKTHSKPTYDVLVKISDCGHNSWQAANKADKAKKGIEKLEGSSDWKSVSHCGSCQGGGVWKVVW